MTRIRTDPRALFLFAGVTTFGTGARAESSRASLAVTRDDGARDCPDSASLAAKVEHIAGRRFFDAEAAVPVETWVQVEFVRSFGGLRAVISARGNRDGTRTLDDVGPGCGSLADAVAITLAILLDPTVEPKSDMVSAAIVALPPPLAVPSPSPVRHDEPPPRRATSTAGVVDYPAFSVEGSAGISFSVLERTLPFAEAGLRARFAKRFLLGAGAGILYPDRISYGDGYIDLTLGYGYLRACGRLLPEGKTSLELCAEPMLGALHGSGSEYDTHDAEWVLWSAVAAAIQVYGTISATTLWSLRALILVPLVRNGFSVAVDGTAEQAFRVPAVGGMLAFGLDVEL